MAVIGTSSGRALLLGGHLITAGVVIPTTGTTALTLIDFVSAYPAKARPVVQRSGRGTTGNVPVLFSWSGAAPGSVRARVRQGAAVIVDWTTLTGLSLGSATGSGVLPGVPLGDHYLLEIQEGATQPTSGPLYSAGTQQWGVGVCILAEGQSNMVYTMGGDYGDPVPGFSGGGEGEYWEANTPGAYFDTAGWHGPGYNNGTRGPGGQSSASLYGNPNAFLRIVAGALSAKYGKPIPVGLTVWAWNSQSIQTFVPGGYHYTDLFANPGLASPRNVVCGDFEAVIWHQGEADTGVSTASYMSSLSTLMRAYLAWVAQFGRTPADFAFFPAVLGNYDVGVCAAIENLRIAVEQFCAQARAGTLSGQTEPWPNVSVGWACLDLLRAPGDVDNASAGTRDPYHFSTGPVARRSLRRAVQTVLKWLGCSSFDGAGPSLTRSYTRSGLVATFDVTIPSGTALTKPGTGGITGFYANTAADFSGADIVVSAALATGNKIAVTFAAGTTFPAYLKYQGGLIGSTAVDANGFTASCYPDARNPVYDTATYPSTATGTDVEARGLPLRPTVGALTIA